ncbi:hypothetical protein ElyMa_000595600 [Elysia marginata]|uniref:Uncharacterized protein n=1 Tax=Elysia marginata TaxID=1093978 RepID=A0AAV4G6A8_9GAST|nr:hypothetical protein ElyMa_000595600 [Elysia marginata]
MGETGELKAAKKILRMIQTSVQQALATPLLEVWKNLLAASSCQGEITITPGLCLNLALAALLSLSSSPRDTWPGSVSSCATDP